MEAAGSLIHHQGNSALNTAAGQPLNVMIDARKLFGGGIGIYIQNLVEGLSAREDLRLNVVTTAEGLKLAEQRQFSWLNNVTIQLDEARSYSPDEYFNFSRRIKFDCDIYHSPHYTLPFRIPVPTVITVHDLIHIHYPEKFYYPVVAKALIRSALRRADRIVAVSQSTRRALEITFPKLQLEGRIAVVPNTLKPRFLREHSNLSDEPSFDRWTSKQPYLLAVFSNLKPHKGARDLLEAYRDLKQDPAYEKISLVLAGSGTEQLAEKDGLLASIGGLRDVYVAGSVSESELRNLYAHALCLVVPSLQEGFCLMAIEAQSQGTPVVARPVPAIRELLLETDICCSDFSQTALLAGIKQAISSPKFEKNQRRAANLDVLKVRFDPERLSSDLFNVYRSIVPENQS